MAQLATAIYGRLVIDSDADGGTGTSLFSNAGICRCCARPTGGCACCAAGRRH